MAMTFEQKLNVWRGLIDLADAATTNSEMQSSLF
jgi:hypothetical protein